MRRTVDAPAAVDTGSGMRGGRAAVASTAVTVSQSPLLPLAVSPSLSPPLSHTLPRSLTTIANE